MSEKMVIATNVHKSFGPLEVLKGISLEVARGEVLCLLGPSGSGKSTFLRCVNHLESIDIGSISVDGEYIGHSLQGRRLHELPPRDVARQRAGVGMVFQRFNLFPHFSALGNVMEAPMLVKGLSRTEARKKGLELLDRVGLADKATSYPIQLSGGQQQRVAIARSLAMDPKLMLLDEPTSALDPELVDDVLDVMLQLAGEGMTMIVVTHEISFARDAADQVVFMDGGVVVERGTASEVLDSPKHQRTQAFLSRVLQSSATKEKR
jgi:polar amino acid transport system ATP-binding protein